MKVGIPRGLFYYQYFPMWKTFLEGLGVEVAVSPPTSKGMLDYGCSRVVGDICLPVKVFCGHVQALAENCDCLFIPSIHSVQHKVYSCPKFIGLPDLVKATVRPCPPVLDPDIDINRTESDLSETLIHMGRVFSQDDVKIRSAAGRALRAHQTYQEMMRRHGLTAPQAMARMFPRSDKKSNAECVALPAMSIALIGHPYILHDEHITHRLVSRLEEVGVNALFPEMLDEKDLNASISEITGKQYWGCEDEVIGAGGYHLRSDSSGIISVIAFGCGPDSVMIEMLQRHARQAAKPFLNLVIDEHTTEGRMVTRVEAFVDMIRQRQSQRPGLGGARTHQPDTGEQKQKPISALGLPNLANIAPAFRSPVEMLGVRLIVPPVTRNTITLGTRYSPEFVCLPFKMVMGSFVEAVQAGADTLFMITSSNACRMGYYARLQEQILRDLGYEFQFLKYRSANKGLLNILRAVKDYTNNAPWLKVIAAYRLGTTKLRALDELERVAQKMRPVELEKGKTDRMYREAVRAIDQATDLSSLKYAVHLYRMKFDQIPTDPMVSPLKVGIVGELYVVMEPLVNINLEVELGKRGVEVRRTRTTFFSEYTNFPSNLHLLNNEKKKLQKLAQPYLARDVGGHGLESVGEKVRLAQEGYDGIVHVMPFTCMPEAIAQNVMLSTREDIPVLNVVCDEQLEQVGLLTRIEAFVDTLEWRRRKKSST